MNNYLLAGSLRTSVPSFVRSLISRNGNHCLSRQSNITQSSVLRPFSMGMNRYFSTPVDKIRNIAIIAHVDHGKTTMVDALLRQSGALKSGVSERVMDSNVLEKERGITILAKNTSFSWKEYKINLVDTPGHGDFGGEVERVLSMVDSVILLVDSVEGVMTQTKFVLSKALKAKLKPIVVLNKMDRKDRVRVDEVENELFDLFCTLEANENQMSYPTLYASAREGWTIKKREDPRVDMSPLFESIIEAAPAPSIMKDSPEFRMLVTNIEPDPHLGRIVTGKILSGSIKPNMRLKVLNREGKQLEEGRVLKLISRVGMDKIHVDSADPGDIIGIAGFNLATVTCTLCDPSIQTAVSSVPIDPPVISITMSVNTSPIAGKEGTQCTFPQLKRRIDRELESNVAISIRENDKKESIDIYGRGEMQLGILLENMRREGYEFSISPPKVLYKFDKESPSIDSDSDEAAKSPKKLEPLEELTIDVDDEYSGIILEKLASRMGEMIDMKQTNGKTRITFLCPSRTIIGLRGELMTETRGSAVMNKIFHSYVPFKGKLETYTKGALISVADGVTTNYALMGLEARGTLFVGPGEKVYQGMIIGEHNKEGDLGVNPVKTKHVSNVRAVSKEETVKLSPKRAFSLEEAITFIKDDELLEITPQNIRFRKVHLDPSKRKN